MVKAARAAMYGRLCDSEDERDETECEPAEHNEHDEADQVTKHIVLVLHDRESVCLAERALRLHRTINKGVTI